MRFESARRNGSSKGRSRLSSSPRPSNKTIAANAGRTTACHAPGRGFEPRRKRVTACVAQLVEQDRLSKSCRRERLIRRGSGNAGRNYILQRCSGHLLVPQPTQSRRMPMGVHWVKASACGSSPRSSHHLSSPVLTRANAGRTTWESACASRRSAVRARPRVTG